MNLSIEQIFWSFATLLLSTIALFVLTQQYAILLVPGVVLFALLCITDYTKIYFLFFACIPFSVELFFDNGLGTDLPTEPIALILMGIAAVLFLHKFSSIPASYVTHPITIILSLHLSWIFFSSLFATNTTISFKYFLAKLWYVIPFWGLSLFFIRKRQTLETALKILIVSLTLVVGIILIRHAGMDFSFKMANKSAHPMFRNHVIYASLLVLILPFVWYFFKNSSKKSLWVSMASIMLLGIYFSYTRAAYASIFILLGAYFVIKYKMTKIVVFASFCIGLLLVTGLIKDNKYLDFAPEYKKTVTHYKFDNLIEATYKLEDISTMERVYRWVAGVQMVKDKPLLGFGPGCFHDNYKDYVVSSFRTYVSNNPDKSGIHNYFFMTWVEQGVFGLFLILLLCIYPIIYGENLYHRLASARDKEMLMAAILFLVGFDAILLINDLIETDKLGSLFWLNLAIITSIGVKHAQENPKHLEATSSH